ncbi:MAG: RsmE family RNA methyltransferase [Candidatus Gracilibacteria bacterium]|jgi:16S rRNA (uracil1498-N3)-methyltransferase
MQHFFINEDLNKNKILVSEREILHQLKDVLRMRVGEEIVFLDNKGTKVYAKVLFVQNKGVEFEILKREFFEEEKRKICLYCALSRKPATFEIIVQKVTEIGVTDIFPLITERCQVRELRKKDRLELIIKEAGEQCERVFLPKLHDAIDLKNLIESMPKGLLVGDARIYDKNISEIKILKEEDINLLIGPEGGLSDNEIEILKNIGAIVFLMGKNVLRMETAAICALAKLIF